MISTATRFARGPASSNPIPNGCVLYAPLWHPSCQGITFQSIDPYGHTFTRTGGVVGSNGITMDGDDVIKVAASPSFVSATGAVEVWYASDDTPTSSETIISAYKTTDANNDYFDIYAQSNRIQFYIKVGGVVKLDAHWTMVPDTSFHHVVVTQDGTGYKIYFDGVLKNWTAKASGEYTNTDWTASFSPCAVILGSSRTGVSLYFDGVEGEVGLYNRAPTPAEILYIYNQTKGRYL